jgi:hypothetical protein
MLDFASSKKTARFVIKVRFDRKNLKFKYFIFFEIFGMKI